MLIGAADNAMDGTAAKSTWQIGASKSAMDGTMETYRPAGQKFYVQGIQYMFNSTVENNRTGTAAEKQAAMREAGIEVAQSPADMGDAMMRAINREPVGA